MDYQKYDKDRRFQKKSLALIEQINAILDEYREQGFTLTLRQIYYQLVGRDIIKNDQKVYDNLGTLIKNGRNAGRIAWDMVVDRTRELHVLPHWETPASIIRAAANQYRRDLWEGQKTYCEVWVEKDALIGIVEQAADRLACPCFSCRGYDSTSSIREAAKRFIEKTGQGKECIIIHIGDCDPSGQHMTEDIGNRLAYYEATVTVNRIALNMDQVELYKLPPNVLKKDKEKKKYSDSRAMAYIKKYGKKSWEVDALRPEVLTELITTAIKNRLDQKKYDKALKKMEAERKQIQALQEYL